MCNPEIKEERIVDKGTTQKKKKKKKIKAQNRQENIQIATAKMLHLHKRQKTLTVRGCLDEVSI